MGDFGVFVGPGVLVGFFVGVGTGVFVGPGVLIGSGSHWKKLSEITHCPHPGWSKVNERLKVPQIAP